MNYNVLVLADGTTFGGSSFGAPALTIPEIRKALSSDGKDGKQVPLLTTVGEVVFNTAMTGYVEVLTDPSYTGQIVAMTYPHIGNYGVSSEWMESRPAEASSPTVRAGRLRGATPAGFVVRDVYRGPVPPGREGLSEFLARTGIPGISGVDTRRLTLHLRDHGSMNALMCRPAGENAYNAPELSPKERGEALDILNSFPAMEGRGLIDEVGSIEPRELAIPSPSDPSSPDDYSGSEIHLVLYDCGAKENIIRELQRLHCRLTLMPSRATAGDIRNVGADAVLISNGPGDPAVLRHQVAQTKELIGTMPVLGICLGHQIIAEALGAKTEKMKFGHHGVNHPVRDEYTRKVFVTSQNHGFTVDESSLPPGVSVWFRNANDGSIEGLRDDARRIRSTQFHPESAPGPSDSEWIFEAFLQAIPGYSKEM